MKRVTGIGGIFFKAKDAPALQAWYKRHLGIDVQAWGGAAFDWSDAEGKPIVGIFQHRQSDTGVVAGVRREARCAFGDVPAVVEPCAVGGGHVHFFEAILSDIGDIETAGGSVE